jgi:hypothetical protein
MTDFDRETHRPGYSYPGPSTSNSAMWMVGAIVVVLILGMVGYSFTGHNAGNRPQSSIQQTTTQPSLATSPESPAPAPKP